MKMIKVKDLLVGKYPVKQRQYEKMMKCNPSYFKGKRLPVERITWYDAIKFCNKLSKKEGLAKCYDKDCKVIENTDGYRLPTEEEWLSFADDDYKYSGSDDIKKVAWYWGNSERKTHKVGLKKPNAFGLYDVTGNIWEWCYSYDNIKPLRGGSWINNESDCGLSDRYGYLAGSSYSDGGFRVIRDIG